MMSFFASSARLQFNGFFFVEFNKLQKRGKTSDLFVFSVLKLSREVSFICNYYVNVSREPICLHAFQVTTFVCVSYDR